MHLQAGSQVCKRIHVTLMVKDMCNTCSRPLRPITMGAIMVVRASDRSLLGSWGSVNLLTVSGPAGIDDVIAHLTVQYLLDLEHTVPDDDVITVFT